MTDQVFELENFHGPLDLLLHLVREQELEIEDVDLSKLCDQYLVAISAMQAVDINVAGEFLVMASTLILAKSRALLPREEEINIEEELDPGDELIQQLLEYRKFKTLSMELGERAGDRGKRHQRGLRELPPDDENELEEIELWDLVGSFVRIMEELGLQREFHTLTAERPLREYIRDTLSLLVSRPRWTLREVLLATGEPDQVYGFFLSLLELVRSQQVRVHQDGHAQDIQIELREDRDPGRLSFHDVDPLGQEGAADAAEGVASSLMVGEAEAPRPAPAETGADAASEQGAAAESR